MSFPTPRTLATDFTDYTDFNFSLCPLWLLITTKYQWLYTTGEFSFPRKITKQYTRTAPPMQGKNYFFSKKVEIPDKYPLTTKKGLFTATRPGHRESSTEHPASLFEFLFVILLFEF
jgi:hypothetical protein